MPMIVAARWAISNPFKASERDATMEAHKAYLGSAPFDILASGPCQTQDGGAAALIIAKVESLDAFRRFSDGDPFVSSGVYREVRIAQWTVTRGLLSPL